MGYAPAKKRVSNCDTVAAPTGGIDDTSPIANMDPNFALAMMNYFPTPGALKVRWGFREWVTDLPSPAQTIMSYTPADDIPELFACTDDGIYDITSSTDTPVLVKAITNGDVIWTMFSNISGQWLIGCNGTDPAFLYDGTSWIDFVTDATPTNPGEINGTLSPSGIAFVHQHKSRIWFLESGSMSAWYMDLNAVAGDVTEFPLGGIFKKGGALNALFSASSDAAADLNDYLVIQSDEGELAAYGGSDPDDANDFSLSARYFIGRPLSRRTNATMGSDVLILTQYGAVTYSNIVGGRYRLGASETTATGRISKTLNDAVRQRQFDPGWELSASPGYQYMILSVPESGGLPSVQLVMNSVTGAWGAFDLDAITFYEFGNFIYFSDSDNRILQYGSSTVDNVMLDGSGGQSIIAGFQQAYNYFGDFSTSKHFKLIRPVFETTSSPNYLLTVSTDFAPGGLTLLGTPGLFSLSTSQWDQALWDDGIWSPALTAFQEWVGIQDIGYCASLIVKTNSTIELQYDGANWVFEKGVGL